MTTHVFVVTEQSFKVHLEYQFVGTGSKNEDVDFNGLTTSLKHHATENGLVGMMADFSRVRRDDYVIFYVQASPNKEGKFYGIYRIDSEPFLEPAGNNQYLYTSLGKNLTFRALIKPYRVFAHGVTEWEALDNIQGVNDPRQMLWSLIYRKLKGNRGNTMITIPEAERLSNLISAKNNHIDISGAAFSYNGHCQIALQAAAPPYTGNTNITFDILPRLISKKTQGQAYESHLQMFIAQQIGRHQSLNSALKVNPQTIEWIGNEVSCGVGMQRIDLMFSQTLDGIGREIVPIELKAVAASDDNVRQITRYIDWIEQYYQPTQPGIIRPVLICPASVLSAQTKTAFHTFNAAGAGRHLPLEYIEFTDQNGNLIFTNTPY